LKITAAHIPGLELENCLDLIKGVKNFKEGKNDSFHLEHGVIYMGLSFLLAW